MCLLMKESNMIGNWEIKEKLLFGSNERLQDSYKSINPMSKIPSLVHQVENHDDFVIFESHAILKYICDMKQLPDHWYPTSICKHRSEAEEGI